MLTPDPDDLPSLSLLGGEDDQGHGIVLLCIGHQQTVLAGELSARSNRLLEFGTVGS